MLEFAAIRVGTGEPLGCRLCMPALVPTYDPVAEIVERIHAAVSAHSALPGPNLVLTGPEPFAHPELPQVVAACVAAGAERIALETDACALSVRANAAGVLAAGVRHLHVRVLDLDDAVGDERIGRPGAVRDARAGIREYLEAAEASAVAVAVTAIVPVCRHSLERLPVIASAAAALGVHALRLETAGALPASAGAAVAAACDTGMVNRLWVEVDPGLPLPGTHALHVAPGVVRRD